MTIDKAYDQWSATYDHVDNKTRDLDLRAFKAFIANQRFEHIVEIGCGTAKNTQWLADRAGKISALDFSSGMLDIARQKLPASHVEFKQADINAAWPIADRCADLVGCNLVLEHVENLHHVFAEAYRVLQPGKVCYVAELHPYRQYRESRAHFYHQDTKRDIDVFVHHISDYADAALAAGFHISALKEFWDDDATDKPPRLICLILQSAMPAN